MAVLGRSDGRNHAQRSASKDVGGASSSVEPGATASGDTHTAAQPPIAWSRKRHRLELVRSRTTGASGVRRLGNLLVLALLASIVLDACGGTSGLRAPTRAERAQMIAAVDKDWAFYAESPAPYDHPAFRSSHPDFQSLHYRPRVVSIRVSKRDPRLAAAVESAFPARSAARRRRCAWTGVAMWVEPTFDQPTGRGGPWSRSQPAAPI
jgi:hypothetical protein